MKQLTSPILLLIALCVVCAFSQNSFAQVSGTKPELILYKHNSGPGGAEPVVQGDLLGEIKFNALTETNNVPTAVSMRAYATGPVSPGVLPANLIFRTGAAGPFDRMVITDNGLVGIGTLTPAFNLHTVGNTHTTGDFFGRIHFDDNVFTNDAPNTYIDEAYFERKNRSVLTGGLALPPSLNAQGGLLSLAPGGSSLDHQLFFGDDGIWNRRKAGNAADWLGADWSKLLTSEDINGTPNRIAKFTAPSALGDSQLWDDGTNVGIATTTPTAKLDVNGNTRLGGDATVSSDLQVNGNGTLNGTLTAGSNASIGGNLGVNGNTTVGNTLVVANNANVGGDLAVNASAHIGADARVDGRIIVGNPPTTPGSYMMYVNGSLIATEVKVALQANWPDYVFEPDYTTPDLAEWADFIAKNKHLPGVPSAAEVSKNGGIELGEMNRVLLQKVEELTLLLIAQQKEIDALKVARQTPQH